MGVIKVSDRAMVSSVMRRLRMRTFLIQTRHDGRDHYQDTTSTTDEYVGAKDVEIEDSEYRTKEVGFKTKARGR